MSVNAYNSTTGESITLANGMRIALYTKEAYKLAKQQGRVANNILVGITNDYPADETNNYSTDETKTFSKWIDGKPIYRKVVNLGSLPSNTTNSVTHGISNIDKVIGFNAFGISSDTNTRISIPYPTTDSGNIQAWVDKSSVYIRTTVTSWAHYSGYAIIEYTKTTDT